MAIPFSRFSHSPPARWRGRLRHGPQLLIPLLGLDITIMVLVAASMAYSATATAYRGSTNIGMYWGGSTSEKAGNVFLYLAVPVIDLFHLLAQAAAYLSAPKPRHPSRPRSSPLLHPAAALSGALVSFCLWTYQVPIATVMDLIGWEQPSDAAWNGLAVARCVLGVGMWLLWTVYAGYAAAAVHCWRKGKARTAEERVREEGRAQGWDEGRREAEGEGLELRGLGSAAGKASKVSGETMVDVGLEEGEGGDGGRKL